MAITLPPTTPGARGRLPRSVGVAIVLLATASGIAAAIGTAIDQPAYGGLVSIPRGFGPRSCSATARPSKHALVSHGYYTMCGPADGVIRSKGTAYETAGLPTTTRPMPGSSERR
jgi:hypothetical protein